MDGSLITTLTPGLLSPHLSSRTCVRVSVCVCACVSVSGSGGVIYCQHRAHTNCSLADFLFSPHSLAARHRSTHRKVRVEHSTMLSCTSRQLPFSFVYMVIFFKIRFISSYNLFLSFTKRPGERDYRCT